MAALVHADFSRVAEGVAELDRAIERFLGTPRAEVAQVARETLEGQLRSALSRHAPETDPQRLRRKDKAGGLCTFRLLGDLVDSVVGDATEVNAEVLARHGLNLEYSIRPSKAVNGIASSNEYGIFN